MPLGSRCCCSSPRSAGCGCWSNQGRLGCPRGRRLALQAQPFEGARALCCRQGSRFLTSGSSASEPESPVLPRGAQEQKLGRRWQHGVGTALCWAVRGAKLQPAGGSHAVGESRR